MREAVLGVLGVGTGLALVLIFAVLEIGGITFRKDCVTPQGTVKHDWTFQWYAPIPYVFRPSQPGCAVHTGTRVALNEIGLFPYTENPGRILAKSGGSAAGPDVAYYDAIYAVMTDIAKQVTAGGLLSAPPDFMHHERESLERLNPPSNVASEHAAILQHFEHLDSLLSDAKAAVARRDNAKVEADGREANADLQAMAHTGEEIRATLEPRL
jgi:hypothetical protein